MLSRVTRYFNVKHPWAYPSALAAAGAISAWKTMIAGYPGKFLWLALALSLAAANWAGYQTWKKHRRTARSRKELSAVSLAAGTRMLTWPVILFNGCNTAVALFAVLLVQHAARYGDSHAYMTWQLLRAYASEPVVLRQADQLGNFDVMHPQECAAATSAVRSHLIADPILPDIDRIGMLMADASCSARIGGDLRTASDLQQVVAFPFQLWDRRTGAFEIAHYLLRDERAAEILLLQLKHQDPVTFGLLLRRHTHDHEFMTLVAKVKPA